MSTWGSAYYVRNHPRWTEVGPGLNAWNMRSRGWLDESRVWKPSRPAFTEVIELRPLHHRELPGLLAAELPGTSPSQPLLIEFRVVDRLDAAIPDPAVLVHRFSDNRSYIMRGTSGRESLVVGEVLQYGDPLGIRDEFGRVEILDIDAANRVPRIQLQHRPRSTAGDESKSGTVGVGVAHGAGGVIYLHGRPNPVPPHEPLVKVLEELALHLAVDGVRDIAARNAVRRNALELVADWANGELVHLNRFGSPARPVVRQH